jgi:hypothetical protein
VSFFDLLNFGGSLMLQSFGVAHGRPVKQFLNFPTIIERSLHKGHEFIGDIDGESMPLNSGVQDMAWVLLTLQAGLAVITDARAPAKAERAQTSWPKICGLIPKPPFNVCSRFFFGWHTVYMPYGTRTVKKKILSYDVFAIAYKFRDRN